MKLKKFNENFQNINVFDEYKVILTDEFELDFNFGTVKIDKNTDSPQTHKRIISKNNNLILNEIEYKRKYDYLSIKVILSNEDVNPHFFKKIDELNSHLLSEDWIFKGYYQLDSSFNDKLVKKNIDEFVQSIFLLYKLPVQSHLCIDCKFYCTEDVGYSNYTVDGTDIHCLKNMWTVSNPIIITGLSCPYYKENINDNVYIHICVDDELKDCLYDSMDIDVVEAFKKYNNFSQHRWED